MFFQEFQESLVDYKEMNEDPLSTGHGMNEKDANLRESIRLLGQKIVDQVRVCVSALSEVVHISIFQCYPGISI